MNKLNILILEDDPQERAYLQSILAQLQYHVTGATGDLAEAKDLYLRQQPDVILIDIYLHGRTDGIEFARSVCTQRTPFLFLTSNYDNTTFQLAKTTRPQSYLLKPYNPLELKYAIELAINRAEEPCSQREDMVLVKRGNTISKIDVRSISYIEVEGKYSKLMYGQEKFLVQSPLKELHASLPDHVFLRTHRNYIVNVGQIQKIDTYHNELTLSSGASVPVSRRYLDELLMHYTLLK